MIDASGEFQISEVDPWTWTPIPTNIDTFIVPLSIYVLIKTHTIGVHINSSDKDAVLCMSFLPKYIFVEYILVPQKA